MESIDFRGYTLYPDKIVAISPVKTIKTGKEHWEWEFGFEVIFNGGKVDIVIKSEKDSSGNRVFSESDAEVTANFERNKLKNMLHFFGK